METLFAQDFNIPNWANIQSILVNKVVNVSRINGYSVRVFDIKTHAPRIASMLEDAVSNAYGNNAVIVECLVFENTPQQEAKIHVDGLSPGREGSTEVALNLPLLNPNGAYMIWYGGDYKLLNSYNPATGVEYLDVAWTSFPKEIHRQEILRPSLVKVDTPHRVTNLKDTPRVMMSLRFNPQIYFLDSKTTTAPTG